MAALNMKETEQLRLVRALVESVLRDGFDPADTAPGKNAQLKRGLEAASKSLNTIVQMKGYYPPN